MDKLKCRNIECEQNGWYNCNCNIVDNDRLDLQHKIEEIQKMKETEGISIQENSKTLHDENELLRNNNDILKKKNTEIEKKIKKCKLLFSKWSKTTETNAIDIAFKMNEILQEK